MSSLKNPSFNKSLSTGLLFLLLAIAVAFLIVKYGWGGNSGNAWKETISGDGKGYYSYIDQIFIAENFGHATPDHDVVHDVGGHSVIKYPCGTALLLLPFYLAARLITAVFILSHEASAALQLKAVSVASMIYFLLGSLAVFGLLKRSGIKRLYALPVIFFFFFGTNLMLYVTMLPSMSHAYSFFAVSAFLYFVCSYLEKPAWNYLIASAIFLGLIYLIRPFNLIIVLFVPFLFGSLPAITSFLKKHFSALLVFALIFLLIGSLQHILWYIQTGHFFIWSYQNEGFYFLNPEFLNFLFSFRKGLFIYTPILTLPLIGSIITFRSNKFKSLVFLIFFLLLVYLLSSWWCWTYSDGFGSRAMIEFYPAFMLIAGMTLQRIKKTMRYIFLGLASVFVTLNCIQSYQYTKGILHPEYMNYASYKQLFLKTRAEYSQCVGGVYDLPLYNNYHKQLLAQGQSVNDTVLYIETAAGSRSEQVLSVYSAKREFGSNIVMQQDSALYEAERTWAVVSFDKYDITVNASAEALFVATISYTNQPNDFYFACKLNYLPDGTAQQWDSSEFTLILPKIRSMDYQLNFYIWNKGSGTFYIRNMQVKIYGFGG